MKKLLRNLKYITLTFFGAIVYDLKSGYDNMAKPKEVLNILFWMCIILIFTERWWALRIAIGFYLVAYLWKIIKQGEWRRKIKEKDYEQKKTNG